MDETNNTTFRSGESGPLPNRSCRFFEQEKYWYFRTREGLDIGPFDQLKDAEEGLNGFIGFLKQAQADVVTRITKYIKLQPRKDEKSSTDELPVRMDRFYEQDNYWYFRTREGMDIGPFDDRGNASIGAKGFVSFLEESQPEIVSRVTNYISAV